MYKFCTFFMKNIKVLWNSHNFWLVSNLLCYCLCQAQATTEESSDYYEDAASFLNAKNSESSSHFGVSGGVYNVEVGLEASFEHSFIHNISQYNSKVMSCMTTNIHVMMVHLFKNFTIRDSESRLQWKTFKTKHCFVMLFLTGRYHTHTHN